MKYFWVIFSFLFNITAYVITKFPMNVNRIKVLKAYEPILEVVSIT